tara:strand:- start:2366 stop:3739 length:1374 start_codon:yes stop_codon:yes gene_type:complete
MVVSFRNPNNLYNPNNPNRGEEFTGTNFLGNPNFPQYSALQAGQNFYSNLPNYRGNAYGVNNPVLPNTSKGSSSLGQQMNMNNEMGMANRQATSTNTPPNFRNNLLNYALSPSGKGMAQGLLEASGYSNTPVSMGQALALGMKRSNEAQQYADAQKLKEQQFQFQKDQAKINERLVESQIFKNMNPQQALSNTAKQMKDAFPNLIPGTPEYQNKFMELLKNNASNVTITNEAQGKGAETMAELDARDVSDTRKLVNNNFELISRLGIMESLVDDPDFTTGPLTASTLPIRKFLAEQGFLTDDAKEKVSKQQLFEAYANYLVPRMRVVGSGSTSDFEAQLFASATAGLGKDEQSNRILVKSFKLMQDHMKFAAQEKEDYFYRKLPNGSIAYNLQGFNQHMEQKLKEKPIFKKYESDQAFDDAINNGSLKKNELYYDMVSNQFRIVDDAMIKDAQQNKG